MCTEKKEGEDKCIKRPLPMDPAMRLDCPFIGQSHGCHHGLLQMREAHEAQAEWVNLTSALGGRPRYCFWGWAFYTIAALLVWHGSLLEAPKTESGHAFGVLGL